MAARTTLITEWAKVLQAVDRRQSLLGVTNFAVPNYVREDHLRRWVHQLHLVPNTEVIVLAVWRVHYALPVVYDCDRVLLQDDNWSRNFRTYWKVTDDFKIPRVAAPMPQPPRMSNLEPVQLHVIAFENRKLLAERVVHLIDIWRTEDIRISSGRTFLARRAVVCPREYTVHQIGQLLNLQQLLAIAKNVVVFFSLKDGVHQAVFQSYEVLKVPDFSYLDFVVVIDRDSCPQQRQVVVRSEGDGAALRHFEDNTATSQMEQHVGPELGDGTSFMQRFATSASGIFTRDILQHRVWSRHILSAAAPEAHWAEFQAYTSRNTNIVDFAGLQQEFVAICRTRAEYVAFTLGHSTTGLEHSWTLPCSLRGLDFAWFTSYLRFEMWDDADLETEFTAAHVFPQVTPRESDSIDTLYMVGAVEDGQEAIPILIVVWTMLEDGYHVERVPAKVSRLLQCDLLLTIAGVDALCQHVAVACEISHDSHPCRRQSWYVQEGMKFAIDIMPAPSSEPQIGEGEEECDGTPFVQQGAPCTHVRQNVLAYELTSRHPLQHQWCYTVWWHDISHRHVMMQTSRQFHKRSGDCMFSS